MGHKAGVPEGSVLTHTLFLVFIIDLLYYTQSSIHSFPYACTLSHSYYVAKRPTRTTVNLRRIKMMDCPNADLNRFLKWGQK